MESKVNSFNSITNEESTQLHIKMSSVFLKWSISFLIFLLVDNLILSHLSIFTKVKIIEEDFTLRVNYEYIVISIVVFAILLFERKNFTKALEKKVLSFWLSVMIFSFILRALKIGLMYSQVTMENYNFFMKYFANTFFIQPEIIIYSIAMLFIYLCTENKAVLWLLLYNFVLIVCIYLYEIFYNQFTNFVLYDSMYFVKSILTDYKIYNFYTFFLLGLISKRIAKKIGA